MDGTLVGVGSHNSIWREWSEDIKIVNKIYPTFIEHTNTKCTYWIQALDKFAKWHKLE
jgi:L-amino acid N-acyltransferase YncA